MNELDKIRYTLLGSYTAFLKYFFQLRNGKEFIMSSPLDRESHHVQIAKALTKVMDCQSRRLMINIPPRYGKTEMLIHFVAWVLARHHDSNFLYLSYSKEMAGKQTAAIKEIVSHPHYQRLFGVALKKDTHAKTNFETDKNGAVYASGVGGSITGRGAGVQGVARQAGGIIIDDSIKPHEALSDTIRTSTNEWFKNTVSSRLNNYLAWIVFIGQRTHEDDLAANLLAGMDGQNWDRLVIPAIDDAGNALNPDFQSIEYLKTQRELMPYEFEAQYQQNPQSPGGSMFCRDDFPILVETPKIRKVFMTVDTAETSKEINDATVFSFWGEYRAENNEKCIHWLDCLEIRVEPRDLEREFLTFYNNCKSWWGKPFTAYIETKSTGTTLYSIMSKQQGLIVEPIKRGAESKIARLSKAENYCSAHQVTFTRGIKHYEKCIQHMLKITRINSHKHDDIADTLADAVAIALDKKSFNPSIRSV